MKGYSELVKEALVHASEQGIRLQIYVTETRPQCDGYRMYEELINSRVDCTLVVDSAIGVVLEEVDYVISGAEIVTENGGIVNRLGTYTLAICAKALEKPFYVFAENYKFVRQFPLCQKDLEKDATRNSEFFLCDSSLNTIRESKDVQVLCPICDFTPGQYISFVITDARIFQPSAVSDELLQLFT